MRQPETGTRGVEGIAGIHSAVRVAIVQGKCGLVQRRASESVPVRGLGPIDTAICRSRGYAWGF